MWHLLRGRWVRLCLGRPGTYNKAPGRRRVRLPREPAAVSIWSPGRDAARQGISLSQTGAGAERRGRRWGLWGAGAGPPCALFLRLCHGVGDAAETREPRVRVCACPSGPPGRRLPAPSLTHGCPEWMEASGDISASPGLEPRPTGRFRAWPECSGSCPARARANWEDGRMFPEWLACWPEGRRATGWGTGLSVAPQQRPEPAGISWACWEGGAAFLLPGLETVE